MKSVDNTQKEGAVHVLACLAVLFLGWGPKAAVIAMKVYELLFQWCYTIAA